MSINLDIIEALNQEMVNEMKEVKAEEVKGKDEFLQRNNRTDQKIVQERAVISTSSFSEKTSDLSKKTDLFGKSSSSSLDDLFKSVDDKKTTTTTSSTTSSAYTSTSTQKSGYWNTDTKKELTAEEKAREAVRGLTKRAGERAQREITKEDVYESDSWNMFDLQIKKEEKRREVRLYSEKEKRREYNLDIFKKGALKGVIGAGRGMLEYLYKTR